MVTAGKGFKHKQNVCITSEAGEHQGSVAYSGRIPLPMDVKDSQGEGHRKVAYGLSGATGIVHCLCSKMPMKRNPCNNPRGQGHAEGP